MGQGEDSHEKKKKEEEEKSRGRIEFQSSLKSSPYSDLFIDKKNIKGLRFSMTG